MVLPGTKIKVLASSAQNKGPNSGSIGYVSQAWNPMFVPVQLFRHLKEYGIVRKDTSYPMLTTQSINIVFTRFGLKGRPVVKQTTIQHLRIAPDVATTINNKWAKMLAKAVTTYSKGKSGNSAIRLIGPLKESPEVIDKESFHDIVAKTYSMSLYLHRNRDFASLVSNTAPGGIMYHNRSLTDVINFRQEFLTKRSWAILKAIAIDTKHDKEYKKALLDTYLLPTIVSLQKALSHHVAAELRNSARKLGSELLCDLLLINTDLQTQILEMQLLQNRINRTTFVKRLTGLEDMKKALRSLATARRR
jgi:hypothetical protein